MSKKWFEKGGTGTQLLIAALGRYLYRGGHFGLLAAFVAAPGRFLCVLERSGLDFRRFRVGFGASGGLFFEVFASICACTVRTL